MTPKLPLPSLLAPLFALALSAPASAEDQPAHSYAVLSLAGNSVSTVVSVPNTGSHMDVNRKSRIEIKNPMFDTSAIQAVNGALKQSLPDASTVLLVTPDPGLYLAQNAMFDAPEANRDNREFLKSLLKDRPVNYLILITSYEAEAELKILHEYIGSGRIAGLGFYMDNTLAVTNVDTETNGTGIIAPFAYLTVRLIDAKTLEVLNTVHEKKSSVVANDNRAEHGGRAWNALTAQEKVDILDKLIKVAMNEAVPRLLKN